MDPMHIIEYPTLLEQVKAAAISEATSLVNYQMAGAPHFTKTKSPEKLFSELHDLVNANHDKVWHLWRELCAPKFFKEYPEVTDVFVVEKDSPKKHWIAAASEFF